MFTLFISHLAHSHAVALALASWLTGAEGPLARAWVAVCRGARSLHLTSG